MIIELNGCGALNVQPAEFVKWNGFCPKTPHRAIRRDGDVDRVHAFRGMAQPEQSHALAQPLRRGWVPPAQ